VLSPPLLPLSALRSPFPAHVNGGSNSSGGQPLTTVPAGEPSPPLSLPLPPLVAVSSPPRFLPCASARLRGGRRARPAAHPGALKRGGEPLAARRVQLAAVAASQLAAAATYQLGAATARAPSRGVAACQLAAATARVTFRSMAASLRAAAWLGKPAWRPVDNLRATACGPPAWLARGWVRAQQRGLPAQMPRRARVQQPHTGSSSARLTCLVVCTPDMPRRLPSSQGEIPSTNPFLPHNQHDQVSPTRRCVMSLHARPRPSPCARRSSSSHTRILARRDGQQASTPMHDPRTARFVEPCAQQAQNTSS
jgi:hypothetical protein